MANPDSEPPCLEDLSYVLNHVFLPPKLPQEDDYDHNHDVALCRLACNASQKFAGFLSQPQRQQWSNVNRMLKKLLQTTQVFDKTILVKNILSLGNGEVLVLHIRAQNAALILRRSHNMMGFEVFEVSPTPKAVMSVDGKLICSYPGPAVELPLNVAQDPSFVEQLVSFLLHMDVDQLDSQPTTTKARSTVPETRGTTHPRYISQLLIMILCGMGKEAEVNRIAKRIADDVCWLNARNPWRRSSLWLVLRVAIQTTADCRNIYKEFLVFFQAELLRMFLDCGFSSELLYTTRVKTSRRLHKLGASASPFLLQAVKDVSQAVKRCLQARWSEEQRLQAISASYRPNPTTIEKDITISLLKSRPYLTKVLRPDPYRHTFATFNPSHLPRLRDNYDFHHPNSLLRAIQAESYVALADFELFVQERLDGWVMENSHDELACEQLESCLEQYISAAETQYSSNPEDQSLMLLTIMDLWVALDTVAVIHCPLLLDYSPEIPSSILGPLLLRRARSIQRAAKIELHLRRRHSDAIVATSIYSDTMDESMFAVRYFEQSSSLSALKARIERDATDKRESKRAELDRKNAEHQQLTEDIAERSCECHVSHRSRSCQKCQLQKKADNLHISVHEWPLPSNTLEAKAVVFELKCPKIFSTWRTQTYRILRDIGMAHVSTQSEFRPRALIEDYEGLLPWSKKGTSGRITFGSETKSFLKSHYREVKIPAEVDQVCVNNGLRFKLYDSVKGEYVCSSFTLNLDSYCTLRLPKDGEMLYQHLQYAVAHTTHTHNETIANQGDCPMNLNMHEQLAFSNLRCGPQLQWMNITRELRMGVLSFSREEVHTLITQAAWQIGPLSDDGSVRAWHFELVVPDFGLVLIREAMDLLTRVEANWVEGTTVRTIIYLTSRLLASTTHSQVQKNGYALLHKAREVTHKWMREIVHKLQGAAAAAEASRLQRLACEMAVTCRATFDVDAGTHLDALLNSSADVAILVECAITVHDHTPHHLGSTFLDFQKLLHRDRRLSHFVECRLNERIHAGRSGLDTAITSVWSSYRPGDRWRQLPEPNSRWLTTFTAPLPGQRAQQVHYNLLNGKLLVDGKPLGRLPSDIISHSTYERIFGQKILDVIPADMPGMDYATRSLVNGYQVFFALRDGQQGLIIRARTPTGEVFELVPHQILLSDFPTFFVMEHVHWMDMQNGKLEFRPLDRLWERSPRNWHLDFSPDGHSRMSKGMPKTCDLIDIQSKTFQDIAARICPLEHSEYLTVTFDYPLQTILVELPRFRLSFFVSDGNLESRNFQGMVIDEDQCTQTMIGLSNQLVLRHKDPSFASLPRSRCVLIPHGNIQFSLSSDQNHVRIHIDTRTKSNRQVTWYKYEIDSDLGLLVGNVNLTSRLYRIYLHALCSHPLPDPLTSQTGTDHALQELGAAGSFSFQRLTEADVELLRLIGSISPRRNYYPEHLHVMQTTKWSPDLPALSQHGAFDTTVRSILQYAQSLTIFVEPKDREVNLDYKCNADSFLMTRAARRNAVYYEGGVNGSSSLDKRYDSRDSPRITDHDSDGIEALNTSRLVYAWPVGLTRHLGSSELLNTFKEWRNISGPDPNMSLVYTQEWLRLDLPTKFLSIYDLCRRRTQSISMKFELVFSFAALAYSTPSVQDSNFIPILLAFATVHGLSSIAPPTHMFYDLTDEFEPTRERVRSIIISGTRSLANSPARRLERTPNETNRNFLSRQRAYYEINSQSRVNNAADPLMSQWRLSAPQSPFHHSDDSDWFNTETIMTCITRYFTSCSRNRELRSFTSRVTEMLRANHIDSPLTGENIPIFRPVIPQFNVDLNQLDPPFTLARLLSSRKDHIPARSTRKFGTEAPLEPGFVRPRQSMDTSLLENLISQFQHNSHSPLTQLYSERLERSRRELHGKQISISPKQLPPINDCLAYRDLCQRYLQDFWNLIRSALAPSTATEMILEDAGLWPRIHPRAILYPLASTANIHLSRKWAKSLIAFAELFIEYQHSQRLVEYALRSEVDNFFKELQNAVFNQSDAESHPDWLLIQIQGNFVIRAVQSAVAREMITPSSNHSTVLQLNMGEGKSHVIVPLVAAALADSHKLARVIVLKPLAGQMFHLLVERMAGLTNRRIFYLPFSRNITMNTQQVQNIRNLFEECARIQGILVAQPEHILSFRLMVVEQRLSSSSRHDLAAQVQELRKTQAWLTSTSRDILDESDALLHVRYQLIYTMGQQQLLDDSPDRWNTVQQVFDLVHRHMTQIQQDFPKEVEFKRDETENYGEFSHVRLLGTSASQKLVSRIAQDALDGVLDNLNFIGLRTQPHLRGTVLRFIKERDIDGQTYTDVEQSYKTSALWKGLLLLRGLLAEGILIYVLSQQRWRVDYGLDLKRSLLAVPYRAKDVPSLRSEFGHPDVAICLTCLSYYYGGLTTSQVQECFELLTKLDNPPLEYEKWVKRGKHDIPVLLRQLIGVNMKDAQGFMNDVVPRFQRNQAVVDFFLSQVVFPKDAKEFPSKLGTSGWDLVEQKANFTTGFSGTNDNSDLLPLSITQSDPVNQLQTNAQVLAYLLQPENDRYICTQGTDGQRCSAMEFLALLVGNSELREVRVLLDVGAQMLEMTNKQLVEHWLSLRQDIAAGVFFDDADNLSVLTQDGVVEPLYSSSLFQQLDRCIVYLDDAHTRGTDLKLPLNFQAAVTLGPKVTKDRLVQGCMRMRKLGYGQSVVFCAPPEVDRRIRETEKISSLDRVKVIDVLSWVMSMTCIEIEHHVPHWAQQGVDYYKRRGGDVAFSTSDLDVEHLRKAWLQPAARSLDEMYGQAKKHTLDAVNAIPAMRERLSLLRVTTVRDAQMEEEQEREVSHEVEQEQELERPPRVPPAVHLLDNEVRYFVKHGTIPTSSTIFFPLMTPLRSKSDSMPCLQVQNPWSRQVLATRDFMTTTKNGEEKSFITDYLRPINWIVSHVLEDKSMILVVMSPYEVNTLLQDIRESKHVRLHLYAPRTSQAMKPFDDLTFYCVPSLAPENTAWVSPSLNVRCQLNIWAGQLYLDEYKTYVRLCLLLGVTSGEIRGHSAESDRPVLKRRRIGEIVDSCWFDQSPLTILKTLFGFRRKGMSYQQTHMGKILHARLLSRKDFEE